MVVEFNDESRIYGFRIEPVQLTFILLGAIMGALGIVLLCVGCLATGATRYSVYSGRRSVTGGRISCAIVS